MRIPPGTTARSIPLLSLHSSGARPLNFGQVGDPCVFFPLTDIHGEIIALQCMDIEWLVWLVRVPDPSGGLALSPLYNQRTDPYRSRPPKTRTRSRTTHPSKTTRGRAPVSSNPPQRFGHPPSPVQKVMMIR